MTVKHAHILQHVVFEGPGFIGEWLAAQGAKITTTAWYSADAALPDLADIDLLVCMGGPMSVHDAEQYPWLVTERDFLRQAITRGVPTLGICLGAQQMSLCMGGTVSANPVREIGWYRLTAVDAPSTLPAVLDGLCVLHWHGERFSLPPGAQCLATSSACDIQAALLAPRALALQCHLELMPDGLQQLMEQCADDLAPGPAVQSPETLTQWPPAAYNDMQLALTKLLAWLTLPLKSAKP